MFPAQTASALLYKKRPQQLRSSSLPMPYEASRAAPTRSRNWPLHPIRNTGKGTDRVLKFAGPLRASPAFPPTAGSSGLMAWLTSRIGNLSARCETWISDVVAQTIRLRVLHCQGLEKANARSEPSLRIAHPKSASADTALSGIMARRVMGDRTL